MDCIVLAIKNIAKIFIIIEKIKEKINKVD